MLFLLRCLLGFMENKEWVFQYIFVYKSNPRNKCLYPNLTVCNYVKRGKYIRIQLLLTYKDA